MFFQPKGSTTFHVYVNTLSLRVPRVLYDHWNGTRFLFNKDLFPDKLKNFNGLVLRATSFHFPPYTYQTEEGGWGGWEYLIMETLASNLNFAMDIQPPPNGELWGENKNGSFTGTKCFRL